MATPAEQYEAPGQVTVPKEYLDTVAKASAEARNYSGKTLKGQEEIYDTLEAIRKGLGIGIAEEAYDPVEDVVDSPFFAWTEWHELESYDQIPTGMAAGKIFEANLFDFTTDFFLPELVGIMYEYTSGDVGAEKVGLTDGDYKLITELAPTPYQELLSELYYWQEESLDAYEERKEELGGEIEETPEEEFEMQPWMRAS